ncbi:MAG: DEAD/DEAH box helicase [Myxococcota bacterium]|nr:DEAD/DEAH box helicase [Myxococcota bacterium]
MTAPPIETPTTEPTFDVMPLAADVRRAIDAMGYLHPTPVQRAVFELAAEGRDLVVQARTGTGKTAAFGLPIVDRIVRPSAKTVQALVLCPTRELALQVSREVEQIGQFRGTRIVPIYGGAPMTRQIAALEAGAQVVVGTPGRVLDHLRQKTLDPSAIRVLVLDEADEMLSMGFAKELNAILALLPKQRQGLFFSATVPADIERLAQNHLRDPELITLSSDQVGALEIAHYLYVMHGGDKIGQLVRILEVEDPESAIIFCNTRDETLRVAEALKARGFDADWLNGDLPQTDRERVMNATKEGKLRFLVATDVAARGIDISHLTHVINHDFPETAEQYVHRTGRTGRAGRTGTAIAIVGPKDIGNVYLLRLTYKIRPIERQLPSLGELKTRAEMDLVQLFVEAFAGRAMHPDDLSLARRLLTHDGAEQIMAGLLRDHLGARGADVAPEAAEARRARNPEPQRPRDDGASLSSARPAPADTRSRQASPAERTHVTPQRERERDRRVRTKPPVDRAKSHAPWTPPKEDDDERPLIGVGADEPGSRLPGVTISNVKPSVRDPFTVTAVDPQSTREAQEDMVARDYVELFVNIGKREGVRPTDLQRLLSEKGLSAQETGRIRVRDRMSYVTVQKDALARAVAALTGQVIGGRTVVAELARGRVGP